ncbi:MAG: chorismate mutase, partial [Bacteroidales bacterium]
ENLATLRRQIDELDNQLLETLAKRMRIAREIAIYKKENNMPVLQSGRYDEIINKRCAQGAEMDLSVDFVKEVMEAIHEESVRQQLELINKK